MVILRAISLLSAALCASAVHFDNRRDLPDADDSGKWPPFNATGGKAWHDAFRKASELVGQMTLEEKANLTSGIDGPCVGMLGSVARLSIPELCLEDGPAGVRPVHGVSQFPAGLTTAATWDRDLIFARSKAMGQEFHDQGVHIPLSPVTGGPLGRAPRGGRNWEGWFADPYATGEASYQSVQGLQASRVQATSKHYIGYEQETFRNPGGTALTSISSNIDDKTTHEVYLWSFAEAVRAGTSHVMCSYNDINGTHACNDAYTQNHLLKTELNFQGSVMSDWGGQHNAIPSALGGLDMSMPGGTGSGAFWVNITEFVRNGSIPESRVNDMVIRTLTPYFWLEQDTHPLPDVVFNANGDFDAPDLYRDVRKKATKTVIRDIGSQSITLLKNTGGLPLNKPSRIAVVGTDAGNSAIGPNLCGQGDTSCSTDVNNPQNGTLTLGGGSGWAYAPYIVTPLDALKARAIADDSEIGWILSDDDVTSIQTLAPISDVTLVFVESWAQEGADRETIVLNHNGDALIAAAVKSSSNVVVVMHIPGVVDVEQWADHPNVTAIVAAWMTGQESGNALVPVLYGDVNPSGKLPFTWGKSEDDYPPNTIVTDPVPAPQSNFTEGVFIDYRWFDSKNITPRYEFGYGLSYTTFKYSGLKFDDTFKADSTSIMNTAEPFDGSNGTSSSLYDVIATYSATVTNTGNATGSEVAQLYVSIPEAGEPVRVLRGFDKVKDLKPGEKGTATFELRRKDLSVWSVARQSWFIPTRTFTIAVGSSSRNLPLTTTWKST